MKKNDSKNIELAERIVEQYAIIEKQEAEVTIDGQVKVDKKGNSVMATHQRAMLLGVLGYSLSTDGPTIKEAKAQMANMIASDLDDGRLVVSNTWAEDNLGA